MPNDCTNSLEIKGITTDQWRSIDDSFAVRDEDHQQDFLKTFIPEPDWSSLPNEEGELPSGRHEHGAAHFPDGKQDTRWYDWRCKHWGTKWDVYGVCRGGTKEEPSDYFSSNFLTAWSPLHKPCMKELSKKFPGATLINFYEEEGEGFCGVTVAKDGFCLDHCEEMHPHQEPFLRQQFPDLEDRLAEYHEEGFGDRESALQELFWDEADLGEFSDFVRDHLKEKLTPLLSRVICAVISKELTK